MFALLASVYGLTPGDVAGLSYAQIKAYLARVASMQHRGEVAVTNGMVPIVNAMFAK